MLRALVFCCLLTVLLLAGGALFAFEVEAIVKKIDPEQRMIVFTSSGMVRAVKVAEGAKLLDATGKEFAEGLNNKALSEGVKVTLTIEKDGAKPIIRGVRLGGKAAPAGDGGRPVAKDTSSLVPLLDLGDGKYKGFPGGLYPDGGSRRPATHEAAGRAFAKGIRPLGKDGKPSADGKIVLLGIGFSNTVQAFMGFIEVAGEDKEINPRVVLVNGAMGGMSAERIQNPNDNGPGTKYWKGVDTALERAGVTRAQVQVIWLKETNPAPHKGEFPAYIHELQEQLTRIVQLLPERFPDCHMVYLSSRTYGGWARGVQPGRGPGNSEPFSYESGFAVKWLIEKQLKSDPALNYDAGKGEVKSPWLSWGPYLWANGTKKRSDGFSHELADFRDNDRMHHSQAGMRKMGQALLQFFKTDSTTNPWFLKPQS